MKHIVIYPRLLATLQINTLPSKWTPDNKMIKITITAFSCGHSSYNCVPSSPQSTLRIMPCQTQNEFVNLVERMEIKYLRKCWVSKENVWLCKEQCLDLFVALQVMLGNEIQVPFLSVTWKVVGTFRNEYFLLLLSSLKKLLFSGHFWWLCPSLNS